MQHNSEMLLRGSGNEGPAEISPEVASERRLAWPDAAKGLCMVLVVLGHSAIWFDQQVDGNASHWLVFTDVLTPFRMPLFFLISGLMSVNALSRPLDMNRKRVTGLFYLYALWTVLFLARLFVPGASDSENPPSAVEIVLSTLLPTPFWYLWALPIYFVLTWAAFRSLGDRSRPWLLIPLIALSSASPWISAVTDTVMREPLDPLKLGPASSNALWFYLGACLPSLWFALMKRACWSYLAGSIVVYAGLIAPVLMWGVRDETKIILAPLALFISSQAFALMSMNSRFMRILQWVGRSTLPVYILHLFGISVISAIVTKTGAADTLTANSLVEISVPLIMACILVGLCVSSGKLILRNRYTAWLLEAPRVLTDPRNARNSTRCE